MAGRSAKRPPRRSLLRKLRSWAQRLLSLLVALVLVASLAVFFLLRSEGFARFVLSKAMPVVENVLPGSISFASFSGGLGSRFELNDVVIEDERGAPFITADKLVLEWEVLDLLFKDVTASRLELHRPVVALRQREDGSLNVVSAFVKPGPPKPSSDEPAKPFPIDIEVGSLVIVDGSFLFARPDGTPIVDVTGIGLDAGYSLRGFEHDASFRNLTAKLDAPIEIPVASLTGGARMHDYVLDLDDVLLRWKDDVLHVDGGLGPVAAITPQLDIEVQRFDLADVKEFAPSAPLRGVLTGPLTLSGSLDELLIAGALKTARGGELTIHSGGLGPGSPLSHEADLSLSGLDLAELLDVPQLPPALTGTITWKGAGTGLDTLRGAATAKLGVINYQKLELGPTRLSATVGDGVVQVEKLAVGLARGTPTLTGAINLLESCFDVRLGGDLGALQDLRERIVAPITSGRAVLNATAAGCWNTATDVVALSTEGSADFADLALTPAETSVKAGSLAWTLDVAIPKAPTGPMMSGPVTVELTELRTAKQVVNSASLRGLLSDARFTVEDFSASSGPDLGLALVGHVDWSELPTVAIHGESLRATYRSVSVEASQAFDFRLREGAFEASGLVADAGEGGRLIIQGTLDPEGDTNALLRLLTFDLVQADAFLPENGKLRGELQDLTVKLTGTSSNPGLSVRTRLRQFATRGRGPIDLDLDIEYANELLTGSASLSDLLTLELGKVPLRFRLDGKGGLPVSLLDNASVDVVLTVLDGPLSRLEAPLGARLPANYVGGKVRGEVRLGGTTSKPTVDGGFLLRDLVVDLTKLEARAVSGFDGERDEGSRQITLQGAYKLADGVLVLRDTKLRTLADGTVLEVGARAAVPLGEWLMAVAGPRELRTEHRPPLVDGLELEVRLRRLPMSLLHLLSPATKPVSGALEGKLVLSGSMSSPVVRSDLNLVGGRVSDRALKRVELDAAIESGKLTAQLELVPELGLNELAGADDARGGGTKGRAGKGRKPTKKEVAAKEASAAEKARILLASTPDAGRLVIRAEAPLPLALDGSRTVKEMFGQPGLHGEVRTDGFPLPLLLAFVPGAIGAKGQLDLSGSVSGSLLDPKPDIRLVMNDGMFKYQPTSVSYENIDIDVKLTSGRVFIDVASLDALPLIRNPLDLVFKPNVSKDRLVSGKRNLVASGSIALDGWKPGELALSIEARRLWAIYTQEIKAQVGGKLTVDGVWPDIHINGTLDVDEVNVEMGQDTFAHKVASMQLPDNLRVHRTSDSGSAGPTLSTFAPVMRIDGTSVLDNYDANVLVRLGNKIRVKLAMGIAQGRDDALRALNMVGSIEPEVNIGGEVRVEITDGKPSVVGSIEVTRDSTLTALTKKFDIRPGSSVTLTGEPLDSRLDLIADYPSSYGSIQVKVTGSSREPQIEFSSDELADQGDIMAVLVTGKPLSEQTSAEGGSLMKTLSSALAGFSTKLLGKYTPLDKLDIDLGEGLSSGSVEAGKALTPELFLLSRFRWGVEDERENRVEAEVQFRPRGLKRFSIEASIGDRLAGGLQIVWRVLY